MSIVGYADLHCHPMAHLSFGGQRGPLAFFWGSPTNPIEQALPCCKAAHSPTGRGGIVPSLTDPEGAGFDGWDTFESWPRHTTTLHQQMYLDCLKDAFKGGLKLMVASAVNNELLADLYDNGHPVDTADEAAILAQIRGMRALADQCSAWMQIVAGPGEARDAIAQGKLAVVLGVEVDSIAGGEMRWGRELAPESAGAVVDRWFAEGVRLINPIHLADNALGGAAIYMDRFNLGNHYLHAKWADDLPEPWFFEAEPVTGDLADVRFLLGANREEDALINLYAQGYPLYMKQLGLTGHANKRGITGAGRAFLEAMMARGMLIDVDHMSSHTLDAALDMAEQRSYPLVSSHTGIRALAVPRPITKGSPLYVHGEATEAMRSDRQLRRLCALGSIVGIFGHMGVVEDLAIDSSAAWARAYKYARDKLGFDRLAIGTDMNGLAQAPGPRFVKDPAAPHGLRAIDRNDRVRPIVYGTDVIPIIGRALQQTALGRKKFDYNTHGLAHYGMLPDFTLDVALQLGAAEALGAFFRSAEAFIEVWEKCVAATA